MEIGALQVLWPAIFSAAAALYLRPLSCQQYWHQKSHLKHFYPFVTIGEQLGWKATSTGLNTFFLSWSKLFELNKEKKKLSLRWVNLILITPQVNCLHMNCTHHRVFAHQHADSFGEIWFPSLRSTNWMFVFAKLRQTPKTHWEEIACSCELWWFWKDSGGGYWSSAP